MALAALVALDQFGLSLHVGDWMESLPFAYQVATKITVILLFIVMPFAALIALEGTRRNT
jgi:hypothetical protein